MASLEKLMVGWNEHRAETVRCGMTSRDDVESAVWKASVGLWDRNFT
jgi:hypothetical protein